MFPSPPCSIGLPLGGVRSSRPLSASIVSRSASASSRRFGIRQTSTSSGSASKFFSSNCEES